MVVRLIADKSHRAGVGHGNTETSCWNLDTKVAVASCTKSGKSGSCKV